MPLDKSKTDDAVHKNVKRLVDEGKPLKQAIAISLSVAGKSKDKKPEK